MKIDIFSDPICPWCYIGKQNLELAIAQMQAHTPDWSIPHIKWFPFQLNPDMPKAGMDRQTYLSTKFGSAAKAAEIYQNIDNAAQKSGLSLQFDKIQVTPNTLKAHSLILWAQNDDFPKQQIGDISALLSSLFQAYFETGQNIGDPECLQRLAQDAGYHLQDIISVLGDTKLEKDITAFDQMGRNMGITGVPFFIFNEKQASSGALSVAQFVDIFKQQDHEA